MVAAQALADEAYGLYKGTDLKTTKVTSKNITDLTGIATKFSFKPTWAVEAGPSQKTYYQLKGFDYSENGFVATWSSSSGEWDVKKGDLKTSGSGTGDSGTGAGSGSVS